MLRINFEHIFENADAFAAFSADLVAICNKHFSAPREVEAHRAPVTTITASSAPAYTEDKTHSPIMPASVPNSETAVSESAAAAAVDAATAPGDSGSTPASPAPSLQSQMQTPVIKRKRRSRAEMAAAREVGAVAPLPSAGGFGGPAATSAPVAPAGDRIEIDAADDPFDPLRKTASKPAPAAAAAPSAGTGTIEELKAAFNAVFAHPDADPHIMGLFDRFGVRQFRDIKPEQYAAATVALVAMRAELMPDERK
jgi:hypothetical protein